MAKIREIQQLVSQVPPAVILVVDDEEDTRAIVRMSFSKERHTIVEAEDGQQALECCRKSLPDLIITDIMMPHLDGNEFVKWFREEFRDQYVPILMLTARGEIEEKVKGFELGADDYLTKPFNYRELQARVSALLRTKILTQSLLSRSKELEQANAELSRVQKELVKKERELVTMQLAGAASHSLRQPVTSILLNCRILEQRLGASGEKADVAQAVNPAIEAIKSECENMIAVLDKLETVDPNKTENYVAGLTILDIK